MISWFISNGCYAGA